MRENKDTSKKNDTGANPGLEEKKAPLTARLEQQLAEHARLEAAAWANLRGLGYGE